MQRHSSDVLRDLGIIVLSVVAAVAISRSGLAGDLLTAVRGFELAASFLAGMFFVSAFTLAPAAAVLAELFRAAPPLEVAAVAALGGLAGDWIMFRFLRDRVAEDAAFLIRHTGFRRAAAVARLKCLSWLTPLLGALIVASPCPDELGLALMGFSRLRTAVFIPLSFALNFVGILAVGLALRAVA